MNKKILWVVGGLFVIVLIYVLASSGSKQGVEDLDQKQPGTVTGRKSVTGAPIIANEYIDIKDFLFSKRILTVKPGTNVIWTNRDSINHTVTSDSGWFDSKVLAPGQTYEYVFETKGAYPYKCTIHPSVLGTVIVE